LSKFRIDRPGELLQEPLDHQRDSTANQLYLFLCQLTLVRLAINVMVDDLGDFGPQQCLLALIELVVVDEGDI